MRIKVYNPEVLYSEDGIVKIRRQDMEQLERKAQENDRQRIRLCAHKDVNDRLHEMFIIHARDTYVRPHKHLNKSESFHVIEGAVDVVFFDEEGGLSDVVRMGDYSSGRFFYYRIAQPLYHTLRITSEILVFHETTSGPFNRSEMVFAPWAPEEGEPGRHKEYMKKLSQDVDAFSARES